MYDGGDGTDAFGDICVAHCDFGCGPHVVHMRHVTGLGALVTRLCTRGGSCGNGDNDTSRSMRVLAIPIGYKP